MNTGVGCHFLIQGIFLTQGSNLGLLHWQVDSLPLNYPGSPKRSWSRLKRPQFACGHGCMFCEHIEKHFGFPFFFFLIGVSKIEFCSFFYWMKYSLNFVFFNIQKFHTHNFIKSCNNPPFPTSISPLPTSLSPLVTTNLFSIPVTLLLAGKKRLCWTLYMGGLYDT